MRLLAGSLTAVIDNVGVTKMAEVTPLASVTILRVETELNEAMLAGPTEPSAAATRTAS